MGESNEGRGRESDVKGVKEGRSATCDSGHLWIWLVEVGGQKRVVHCFFFNILADIQRRKVDGRGRRRGWVGNPSQNWTYLGIS